jgi:hypothetical protein
MLVELQLEHILSQDNRHVAYFSENMNDTKRNYSTYDKEFYAVIQALKKWRHYLVPMLAPEVTPGLQQE